MMRILIMPEVRRQKSKDGRQKTEDGSNPKNFFFSIKAEPYCPITFLLLVFQ
jgi:hypothetical protein